MVQKEQLKPDGRLAEIVKKAKRVVVKVGSSILVGKDERVSEDALSEMAAEIAAVQKKKVHVALVSSGAIASGMRALGFQKKPQRIPELQACAALGQPVLMQLYQKAFDRAQLRVAQVLLTRDDFADRGRFLNAKYALNELLNHNVVPIINENDTVAVDEIRFGDNDNLAALVTNLADADLLVLLTDQDGFYTADPRKDPSASRIAVVENVDKEAFARATDTSTATSVGGMLTKLQAAHKAAQFGIPTVIANGNDPQILPKIFRAEDTGTLFLPSLDALTARKHWIAHNLKPQGLLIVDEGARRALTDGKKSLLPSGVTAAEGSFRAGDAVDIAGGDRTPFARGLAAYGSKEVGLILGRKSSEIVGILGYKGPDEIIHRDNLVML